jgi:hypothetical protein
MTCETVVVDTPARFATSLIVAMKKVLPGLSQLIDKYIVKRLRLRRVLRPKMGGKSAVSGRENHFSRL